MGGPPAWQMGIWGRDIDQQRRWGLLGAMQKHLAPPLPFQGPMWEVMYKQLSELGPKMAHEGAWNFFQDCAKSGRHWWSGPDARFPWTFDDYRPPEQQFAPKGMDM